MLKEFQTEEYLQSRIEWFWKYRQPYINNLKSEKDKEKYKKRMQELLDKNISTYEGSYDIEYCRYCYTPLPKHSVASNYGHCGYSCP